MQILERKLAWLGLSILLLLFVSPMARVSANVDLSYFKATGVLNQVALEWQTASELTTVGFNLYRAESAAGPFTQKLNSAMIPGMMGSPVGKTYTFNDTGVTAGKTYYYQLEGISSTTGSKRYDVKSAAPQAAATATKTKTPVKTNTPVPTIAATATNTPIPTATNTLVPGAPTFTPAPTATATPLVTPTAPRVAVAKPNAPSAPNAPAALPVPNAPSSGAPADPTPINLAPQNASAPEEQAEDAFEEDMPVAENPASGWRNFAIIGMLFTAGGIGFAGALLFGLAALFFVRAQTRR